MLDRDDLESLHELLPETTSATVFPRGADSVLESPVSVSIAEKRPPTRSEQTLLNSVSAELEQATFHLWVVAFASPLSIGTEFVIREPNGKLWAVVQATLEMANTRWRCPCIEYLGSIPS